VYGLGPRKVELLKAAKFEVRSTASPAKEKAGSEEVDAVSLRMGVKTMEEQTWRHRSDTCIYTELKKKAVVKMCPEVDHVIECQILNYAHATACRGKPVTRSVTQQTARLVNSQHNLNVTTHEVNQAKKGPFMRFLNQVDKGQPTQPIEETARESCPDLVDNGNWARIQSSIVQIYDELEAEKAELRDVPVQNHVDSLLGEIHQLMGQMDLY